MKYLIALLILIVAQQSFGQPGTLDHSFGTNGIALSTLVPGTNHCRGIALQPDGKILTTGFLVTGVPTEAYVVRYLPDGTIDMSSNLGGIMISIGTTSYGNAIAVQPDGKIIVAGNYVDSIGTNFFLVRMDTTGFSDITFGTNGFVRTDFSNYSIDETHAMVLQPDGKILIAGCTNSGNKDVAILRYNANGTLDSTFGSAGKVSMDINNFEQDANAMTLQPDGKIIVTGYTYTAATDIEVLIMRYDSNGDLDSTFGINGMLVPHVSQYDDEANAVIIQPDKKIIVSGKTYTPGTFYDNLIMRFDSLGNTDSSFNSNGTLIIDLNHSDNYSTGVLLQNDGKIITTGNAMVNDFDVSLIRINSNGSIDSTYGLYGTVITDIAAGSDLVYASVIQPNQKVIVGGRYTDNGAENYMLCRYNSDSPTTDIASVQLKNTIELYPQPASDFLFVRLDEKYSNKKIIAKIFSTNRQLLKEISLEQNGRIDISSFKNGLFVMNLYYGWELIGEKLFLKIK